MKLAVCVGEITTEKKMQKHKIAHNSCDCSNCGKSVLPSINRRFSSNFYSNCGCNFKMIVIIFTDSIHAIQIKKKSKNYNHEKRSVISIAPNQTSDKVNVD